jgi:hypothetical protein
MASRVEASPADVMWIRVEIGEVKKPSFEDFKGGMTLARGDLLFDRLTDSLLSGGPGCLSISFVDRIFSSALDIKLSSDVRVLCSAICRSG